MPLAAQLPADGGFGLPHSSSLVHPFLFVQAYCLVCLLIANKGVYQEVLIPVGIALRVHIFCNGVRSYFSDISGFKFDEIAPSVKDWVLMCPWQWSPVLPGTPRPFPRQQQLPEPGNPHY